MTEETDPKMEIEIKREREAMRDSINNVGMG